MKPGDRLILNFTSRGSHSGHAAVVCVSPGERTSKVVRVTQQNHDVDHAPTHYRRVTVATTRLRPPTPAELADASLLQIWHAIEQRHPFMATQDDNRPIPSEPPPPIDEIAASLRVVRQLIDELPAGAPTTRLAVAVETAQAAAASHPSRKPRR